jgi:ribosomal protein S18 acetylase RimI-like enzyme
LYILTQTDAETYTSRGDLPFFEEPFAMQTSDVLVIRQMSPPDLEQTLEWAAAEGWNPGLHDVHPFLAADPSGFFLGQVDREPVGSFSAVAYGQSYGFLGLYIVRPEFRGRRFGAALWNAGLDYLGSRTIGLDGVVAQQDNYRRKGFEIAYRTFRYEGTAGKERSAIASSSLNLVDLRSISPADLAAYDAQLFPAPRPNFLQAWVRQPGTSALGLIGDAGLTACGVARPCRTGYRIGPLFADDPSLAQLLFNALTSTIPGQTVYLDVPEPNRAAASLADRHGMKPVFETARMYRGPAPAVDLNRVFGVTSLELG